MYLSTLRLQNFRSYPQLDLELTPGITLIVGRNGEGKTSLLEAISMLALTRSPRTAYLGECASWGSNHFGIHGEVRAAGLAKRMEFRAELSPADRWVRRLRLSGAAANPRELLGELRVVLFWPEDLALVKGGPDVRRRHLDMALSQLQPGYAEDSVRYRRALDQRNQLLQRIRREEEVGLPDLSPWDDAVCTYGARVIQARCRYLNEAEPLFKDAALGIGEELEVDLSYRPALSGKQAGPQEDTEAQLRASLRLRHQEERIRGTTVSGPHRDDFDICLGGRPARQFASQGQQRSIALALKQAEVGLHLSRCGESPLLLLDDVLSELDRGRRQGLVAALSERLGVEQTLVTSADDETEAQGMDISQLLVVTRGRVSAVDGAGGSDHGRD